MAPVKRSKGSRVVSDSSGDQAMSDEQRISSDFGSASWPEIFSQHKLNLEKHLGICQMVKNHVLPQTDSHHVVGAMVDRAQGLLKELETLRNEFLPSNRATEILLGKNLKGLNGQGPANGTTRDVPHDPDSFTETSAQNDASANQASGITASSIPSFVFDKDPVPVSVPHRLKSGAKRTREDVGAENGGPESISSSSNRKRKKTKGVDQDAPENGPAVVTSTSAPQVGVEDISEEVEARLKLKEEKRKRKEEKKGKKRKRDSTASAIQASPTEGSSDKPTKRSKTDAGASEEQDTAAAPKAKEKKKSKRRAADDASEEGKHEEGENGGKRSKKARK